MTFEAAAVEACREATVATGAGDIVVFEVRDGVWDWAQQYTERWETIPDGSVVRVTIRGAE